MYFDLSEEQSRDDYDALAGALAAGHIIECGCQAAWLPMMASLTQEIQEVLLDFAFL